MRLQRHQKVMTRLLLMSSNRIKKQPLEELCMDCGYYNSSHLITDFFDIMGYNPSDLLKRHCPESYSWTDVEETAVRNK